VHEGEAKQKLVGTCSSQTNMLLGVLIGCKAVVTRQQKAFVNLELMISIFHCQKQNSPWSGLLYKITENKHHHDALEEYSWHKGSSSDD
jgi:hypothetical protein